MNDLGEAIEVEQHPGTTPSLYALSGRVGGQRIIVPFGTSVRPLPDVAGWLDHVTCFYKSHLSFYYFGLIRARPRIYSFIELFPFSSVLAHIA
jgi:hypothetical protein